MKKLAKFALWLLAILIALLILIYCLIFTPPGNAIVRPIAQNYINDYSPVPLSLDKFALSFSRLEVALNSGEKLSITLNGDLALLSLGADLKLDIDARDISLFGDLVGMPKEMELKGAFKVAATASGDKDKMDIALDTNLAKGQTALRATLVNFEPADLTLRAKNLRIAEALAIIGQKPYADAKLSANADIKGKMESGALVLDGAANATLTEGSLNNTLIAKDFNLTGMPKVPFNAILTANIAKDAVAHKLKFNSDLAALESTGVTGLNDFESALNYVATLPDLKKLKFITKHEMVGKIIANGEVKAGKKLIATFNTKSLGGNMNAVLDGDLATAKLNNLNTLNLLKMAQMPEVFSSKINGDLNYNIKTQRGKLAASISEGRMLSNQLSDLAAKYLKLNLTNEVYNDASVSADIAGLDIVGDLSMKSNNTSIAAKGAKISLEKSSIDARLDAGIKERKIAVLLSGNLMKPSVNIDAGDLLKAEAGKLIDKNIDKLDKIKGGDKIKGLIKNLF